MILSNIYGFLKHDRLIFFALLVVMLYVLMAAGFECYGVYCRMNEIVPVYEVGSMSECFRPPSPDHWLGTDYLGRDVLWRALAGSATAVKVGLLASLIAAFIGVTLGLLAGFHGGSIDDAVVWTYSVFASMPTLLFVLAFALLVTKGFLYPPLAAAFAAFAGIFNTSPDMMAIYLGIGMTGWVTLCRVVRTETMKLRNTSYVQAAFVSGLGNLRIIFRHVLPNVFHLVIIYFTIRFAYAIMTEVIVSYLGLGVQTAPSWGVMIADGQSRLWRGIWWEVAAAGAFMFVLVLSLHVLGDALRDWLDPRLKD